MISSYGDQSTTENNPSYYYYRLHNAASIALDISETPYVLYMQLQHQGNS